MTLTEEKEMIDRFLAEKDKVINNAMAERDAFVQRWLVSRGWDGKDLEQARKLADGWTVVHDFNGGKVTLRIIKLPAIIKENGMLFFMDKEHKINLTAMFGEGKEPSTVEEFLAVFPK